MKTLSTHHQDVIMDNRFRLLKRPAVHWGDKSGIVNKIVDGTMVNIQRSSCGLKGVLWDWGDEGRGTGETRHLYKPRR